MVDVSNSDIAAYLPLTRKLAVRYERYAWGIGVFAEYDDLEQEGRIRVWRTLQYGFPVSKKAVEDAMKDWIDKCRRQQGGSYAVSADA